MTSLRDPEGTADRNEDEGERPAPGLGEGVGRLAELTARAVEDIAGAARAGDAVAARRVLRRSAGRRLARTEADLVVRGRLSQRPLAPGVLRRVTCELQLVAELGHVGELVDALARQVAGGGTPHLVVHLLADDLETLGGAGAQRLRHLAHLSGPAMDGRYLREGAALRESLNRLAGHPCSGRSSAGAGAPAAVTCSCLIRAVLSASSFAARIA